ETLRGDERARHADDVGIRVELQTFALRPIAAEHHPILTEDRPELVEPFLVHIEVRRYLVAMAPSPLDPNAQRQHVRAARTRLRPYRILVDKMGAANPLWGALGSMGNWPSSASTCRSGRKGHALIKHSSA